MGTANRSPVKFDRGLIVADAADRGWDRKALAARVRGIAHERGEVAPAVSTVYRFLEGDDPIQTPRIALLIAVALGHKTPKRYRLAAERRSGRDRRSSEAA
jgi:hypothetical protein